MLKLNVGLSKKIGQPDYGSLGASCHLDVEVEASLLRKPEQLREKIQYLFAQAKQAVEEELHGGQQAADGHHGNGRHDSGNGHQRSNNGRSATASQVRAIHAIANRQRLDLAAELRSRFGVDLPDELSISEASELIDQLKPQTNGSGGRR